MFFRILRDPDPEGNSGGGVNVTPTSGASGTVPMFTQDPPPVDNPAENFIKNIPDAYKDKPYLKGIDSTEKLFSAFDGAQKLIGSRPSGIPDANAPKEAWDNFYKTLGRPEAPDAYTLTPTEGLKYDENFTKGIKGIFHEAGLTQKQVEIVQKGFDKQLLDFSKNAEAKTKQMDIDFDKLAVETFGAEKDIKISKVRALITEHAPKSMTQHLSTISNENLIIMAGVIDSLATKYISADKMPSGNNLPGNNGGTIEQLREEARRLMMTKEFNDPFHPEHNRVREKVTSLYAPLRNNK